MRISKVDARWVLDSRGNPTVEVDLTTSNGATGRASVPSGASTGKREAVELRDGKKAFGGNGVEGALSNISGEIAPAVLGLACEDQTLLDRRLIELDGTANKSRLGANAVLAVSLAAAKAAANAQRIPLYQHIGDLAGNSKFSLPLPLMNIVNGGKHGLGALDIQELMIVPVGAQNLSQAVQTGTEIFHCLGQGLLAAGYPTSVGDEGGYAPPFRAGLDEAIGLVLAAIEAAGYAAGRDVVLALDVAASELVENGTYRIAGAQKTAAAMIKWYQSLRQKYPIISIEDGLGEDDWEGWRRLTIQLGESTQLVGDDLLVTNTDLLNKAIKQKTANAILIKPNQIGTLTETIQAVKTAQAAGWRTIISHRSGETEDTTIAHLAVGLNAGQIKTGSLSRSDRTAKYNELLRISESVPDFAHPF